MKLKAILLYSHTGEIRRLVFKTSGLNVITGKGSTGKSALWEIVEYCMGQSSFDVREGFITERVAWYAVIFEFDGEDVFIAKPPPKKGKNTSSRVCIRRGKDIEAPPMDQLNAIDNDDAVISLLSSRLGFPSHATDVPDYSSRASYRATVQHTYYYLHLKQYLVTNPNQLFYKQNEDFHPQTIRDTLPIILGASSDDWYEKLANLRELKRKLAILEKRIAKSADNDGAQLGKALSLIGEAKAAGLTVREGMPESLSVAVEWLREIVAWKPTEVPKDSSGSLPSHETDLAGLRSRRRDLRRRIEGVEHFAAKAQGFSTEMNEQVARLKSIHAFPRNRSTGEWQWPFAEENLGLSTPVAEAMLNELSALDDALGSVEIERPQLNDFILKQRTELRLIDGKVRQLEDELASLIAQGEEAEKFLDKINSSARVVGRVSAFLDDYSPDYSLMGDEAERTTLLARVERGQQELADNSIEIKLASILNQISTSVTKIIGDLEAENSEFLWRFDLKELTLIIDKDIPVLMNRTGGGSNHLAQHLAILLAIHTYCAKHNRPLPKFLFIDQPTQVYFPDENKFKAADGSVEKTEEDADINAVKKLFRFLLNFTEKVCPGLQLIVTEHANLRDGWFQECLVEPPWSKPPALVPEHWPTA